jgi:hypothetical protein
MEEQNKETTYWVNDERETTKAHELKVGVILDQAGFSPISDWTLRSLDPKHDYDSDYEAVVPIHEDQRFEALHKGPTPAS